MNKTTVFILILFAYGVIGFVLASVGIKANHPAFWGVLLAATAVDILSTIRANL